MQPESKTTVDKHGNIETKELTHDDIHLPANKFRWRDREGEFHDIEQMDTRHLFNTVRMIWNHSMPEAVRSTSYKRYTFSPFYTQAYMEYAIRHICRELWSRTDMTDVQREEIESFRHYLESRRKRLEVPE